MTCYWNNISGDDGLPVICGDKTVLRPIRYTDTDLIVKWRNNDRVKRNFIYRGPFTRETHAQWMDTNVKNGKVVQYIIEDHGKPVGSVYFRDVDQENKSAEFGIFIGEDDAVGKGIGTEATKLFIDFGLIWLDFDRIILRVLPHNKAAYNVYLKVGFAEENVDENGVIFMSITKE